MNVTVATGLLMEGHFAQISTAFGSGRIRKKKPAEDSILRLVTQQIKRKRPWEIPVAPMPRGYVMVNVKAWLVPPLVQPRLPEFPLGVLMVMLAVSGLGMSGGVAPALTLPKSLQVWVPRSCDFFARAGTMLPISRDFQAQRAFRRMKGPRHLRLSLPIQGRMSEMGIFRQLLFLSGMKVLVNG